MNSDRTQEIVIKVLDKLNSLKANYVLIRGWNGESINGSDIDIIIFDKNEDYLMSEIESLGFRRNKRVWSLVDIYADECYLDTLIDDELIRIHISNRILYGKPYRIIRLPYESEIIRTRKFNQSLNSYVLSDEWSQVINLFRVLIDKPSRQYNLDSKNINTIPYEIHKVVSKIINNLSLDIKTNKKLAINSLSKIENSEYRVRYIQKIISYNLNLVRRLINKIKRMVKI